MAKTANNGIAPRRYTDAQLGRLQEIRSVLDCECPNHLSAIVASLAAFERYSQTCEDENPEDAAIHAMLCEQTARARTIIEQALSELLKHEGVEV